MHQTWCSETEVSLRHIYSCNCDVISRSAFSNKFSFREYFYCPRYVTDWNLITWFLNFDVLKTYEFRRSDVHNQLAFNFVLNAFLGGALNEGIKLFLSYNLIYFESAHIATVYCYLHLRFYITCSYNDSFNCD